MNKVGLLINRASEGLEILLTLPKEGGDWTKEAGDVRNILKLYDKSDESRFAMFMSFSTTGTYITVARVISGRRGDFIAAWLYIPNDIEVDGEKISDLIKEVKTQLPLAKLDESKLVEIFNKTYRQTTAAEFITFNEANKVYAKREVGFYPLKDLVGVKRYQAYYANYAAILLITEDSFPVTDQNVKDISEEELEETVVFCQPETLPSGVSLYYFSHEGFKPFDSPVLLEKGTTLDFKLSREGFKPIRFNNKVQENGQHCELPSTLDWEYELTFSKFMVVDVDDGKDITYNRGITIKVNGNELSQEKPLYIPEQSLANTKLEVSASGYEPKTQQENLRQHDIIIKLKREESTKDYNIELANGQRADMILRSRYLGDYSEYESPLKGYKKENGVLHLDESEVWKHRCEGFLAAAALFIMVMICLAIYDWFGSHTFKWQLALPPLTIEEIDEMQPNNHLSPSAPNDSTYYNSGSDASASEGSPNENDSVDTNSHNNDNPKKSEESKESSSSETKVNKATDNKSGNTSLSNNKTNEQKKNKIKISKDTN